MRVPTRSSVVGSRNKASVSFQPGRRKAFEVRGRPGCNRISRIRGASRPSEALFTSRGKKKGWTGGGGGERKGIR